LSRKASRVSEALLKSNRVESFPEAAGMEGSR
jgi:hypothetical protein